MFFRIAGRFVSFTDRSSDGSGLILRSIIVLNDYDSSKVEIGIKRLSLPNFSLGQMIELWLRDENNSIPEAYYWRQIPSLKEYFLLLRLINEVILKRRIMG